MSAQIRQEPESEGEKEQVIVIQNIAMPEI